MYELNDGRSLAKETTSEDHVLESSKSFAVPIGISSPDGPPPNPSEGSPQVAQLMSLQLAANNRSEVSAHKDRVESINGQISGGQSDGPRTFSPPGVQLEASAVGNKEVSQRKRREGNEQVMQLMGVQIEPEPSKTEVKIKKVHFGGRPTHTFTNDGKGSMGDHTTAFGVLEDIFRLGLEGKGAQGALVFCIQQWNAVRNEEINIGLTPSYLKKAKQRREIIVEDLKSLKGSMSIGSIGDENVIVKLQKVIGDILYVWELSHLAKINTKKHHPDDGGQTEGEAPELKLLRGLERKLKKDGTSLSGEINKAPDAIMGLFDFGAVKRALNDPPGDWPEIMSGFPKDGQVEDLYKQLSKRHLKAISLAYPKTFEMVKSGL